MRYRTIVADPPWETERNRGTWPPSPGSKEWGHTPLDYPTLTVPQIAALPVGGLGEDDAHLYLWVIQRYIPAAFTVAAAWGFTYSTMLVWSKPPKGIAGTFVSSSEFVLFCRRGSLKAKTRHVGSVFHWPRPAGHSRKPEAFLDLVESVSPGPYLELFARRQRLGWDTWGDEALEHVEMPA